MSKNLSLVLNVILLIAVSVLYYLHFSSAPSSEITNTTDSTAVIKPIVMTPSEIKASKIVYVNLDVLSKEYDFLKEESAVAQVQQNALQNDYQKKGQKLQQDYMLFQEKASKGLLSENEIKGEQEKFSIRKEELDRLQLKMDDLGEKMQQKSEEAHKNLVAYIKEYNKTGNYNYVLTYSDGPLSPVLFANDSLDITKDILNGINANYKASKK